MKVKMLATTRFEGRVLKAGDVVEVNDDVAKRWATKAIAALPKRAKVEEVDEEADDDETADDGGATGDIPQQESAPRRKGRNK